MTKTSKLPRPRKPKPYQPILELPPLPDDQFAALRENIGINGVLVPILIDEHQQIIDGWHRHRIATELGYECPEIVQEGLTDEEKRLLARALNLSRRQLSQEEKRQVIADQLEETPGRSNRWIGRQLGVHHATVASVRADLVGTGQIIQLDRTLGADGKVRPAFKLAKAVERTAAERKSRLKATKLLHGDCREKLQTIPEQSIDAIITDPIYPEVRREYGRISETDWHDLMRDVIAESRRVLKPTGSMVVILQPNYEKIGKMRLWLWEFVVWAGREWNLVQDAWWWATDAMPLAGTHRTQGLMRQSVKMCVWLGAPDCYRNQDAVLQKPSDALFADYRASSALNESPSGRTHRNGRIAQTAVERGGTTPFNLLPISTGGQPGGSNGHPATTPYTLADWWCRYLLPQDGVLLDPFCGSGTMLAAGLDNGASEVIGIDREKEYLKTARERVRS